MIVNDHLYDSLAEKARQIHVDHVCIGLGYTAVKVSDGGCGVAYTWFDKKTGCTLMHDSEDYEQQPAIALLEKIKSSVPLERTLALALVNALNHGAAIQMEEDGDNHILFDTLDIRQGSRVAMVGFFKPLMKLLERRGAAVEVIDEFRAMGDPDRFYDKLTHWADAALVTSTSLLNNTTETILARVSPKTKVALLGPSTPMLPQAFSNLPVHLLAGTVPVDSDAAIKAVRHGRGTPALHRVSKKVVAVTTAHFK